MQDLAVIKTQLELVRPSFDELNEANGGKLNFINEVEFAVQALSNNSYLATSTPQSIQEALKNVALTGLSLNPVLKYSYLVPRRMGGKVTATLMPSYIGLAKILTDTGAVKGISAEIVHAEEIDSLEIELGIGGFARHRPIFDKKPGEIVACYAKAILADGTPFVSLIRKWEWEDIRNRSEAYKNYVAKKAKGENPAPPVWISDEKEMIKKTLIKNMWKFLPKTDIDIMARIGRVVQLDNDVNGIDFNKEQGKAKVSEKKSMNIEMFDNDVQDNVSEFESFMEKMNDETVPNTFKSKSGKEVNVRAMINGLKDDFENNSLHLEKWNKTRDYLNQVYEAYKNKK